MKQPTQRGTFPSGVLREMRSRWFGNRAVNASLGSRAIQTLSWVVCTPAITKYFTREEQGFHYTFASLLALQIVLEAGVGTVVMQMVAHETGVIDGGLANLAVSRQLPRLAAIAQFARKWFLIVAILAMCGIFTAGYIFFGGNGKSSSVDWLGPWIFACCGLGVSILVIGLSAFLEGMGYVAEVALYRSCAALFGTIAFLGILMRNGGLYATAANIGVPALVIVVLTWNKIGKELRIIYNAVRDDSFSWFKEAGWFQLKIAISWLSGWVIFQMMNPVAFKRFGAAEAGRLGIGLQIATGVQSIAAAWSLTKQSPWGQYVAQNRQVHLMREFRRALLNSFSVAIVMSAVGFIALIFIAREHLAITSRLPEIATMGALFVAAVVNQIVFTEAVYLRAHKQEPFFYISLGFAVAMIVSLYTPATSSPLLMALTYTALTVLIGAGGGTMVFARFRTRRATS